MKDNVKSELLKLQTEEQKWLQKQTKTPQWKETVYEKVPDKLQGTLEKAFCKAFEIVFEKGTAYIEKTFDKENLQMEYEAGNYIFEKYSGKKTMKRLEKTPKKHSLLNHTATTVSGFGMGLLGMGIPDIPLLVSVLLKGVYEIAVSFGFDYEKEEERIYILRLFRAALADSSERMQCNAELDKMTPADRKVEIKKTAKVMADAMLVEKFIQGIPIVGVAGAAVNHSAYKKISKLALLKYKKRYLLKKEKKQ